MSLIRWAPVAIHGFKPMQFVVERIRHKSVFVNKPGRRQEPSLPRQPLILPQAETFQKRLCQLQPASKMKRGKSQRPECKIHRPFGITMDPPKSTTVHTGVQVNLPHLTTRYNFPPQVMAQCPQDRIDVIGRLTPSTMTVAAYSPPIQPLHIWNESNSMLPGNLNAEMPFIRITIKVAQAKAVEPRGPLHDHRTN